MTDIHRQRGKDAERRIARKIGGSRTPYSGAGAEKGDVSHPRYIVEVKTTGAAGIRLQRAWLTKVQKEAEDAGKRPVVVFRFVGDTRDYAVIPLEDVPGLMPEGGAT